MTTEQKIQYISDEFHAIADETDRLIARLARLSADAADVRIEAGLSPIEGQRTLAHLANAQPHLAEFRNKLTLGHASAQKEAERGDHPFQCPDRAQDDADATPLSLVG